jgi:biopolymer transport protein TolQ
MEEKKERQRTKRGGCAQPDLAAGNGKWHGTRGDFGCHRPGRTGFIASRRLAPEFPLIAPGKPPNTAATYMLSALSVPFATVNVWQVFLTTDRVGQGIIVLLAVFSVGAWAVMLGKRSELKQLRELNFRFERMLGQEKHILSLPENMRNRRDIPYADLLADAIEAYWRAAAIGKEKGEDTLRGRLEHAENAIQRALARQTLRYETSMIFLASVVTGAPFLGMFGTVWGVMEAFVSVSVMQTASIQTLAPGVSAALLTTIAGLIVAIPSVFGYNYLLGKVKQMITEMENYASSLADRIELEAKLD